MKKEQRVLPTIHIKGTAFIVDVENGEFREHGNEGNRFSLFDLSYKGTYYEMAYDERLKNPLFAHPRKCIVRIPQLIEIDPEGMAAKYKVSVKDLEGKNDFDFRVDQQMYTERVFLGRIPVIDIDGDRFFVDMRFNELRWTKDYSKLINLQDREVGSGQYFFYYDKGTKQAVTIDRGITDLPENVVKVVVPEDHILDPLVHAQRTNVFRPHVGINEVKDYLMKLPFHKDLKAEIIPLSMTGLAEKIKVNKDAKRVENTDALLTKVRKTSGEGKRI